MSLANQLSREDMLRELELLPVWQLRQPLPAQLKTSVSCADAGQPEVSKPELTQFELSQPELSQPELTQPEVAAPESAVAGLPVIESQPAEYAVPELLEPLPVEVEPPEAAPEFVPEQVQALPLRLLLSEANVYAFLIEPYAAGFDAEPVETLLRNMMRAMQLDSRVDITDSADKLLAAYVPKVIISLGAEPANQLFGTTRHTEGWRTAQQQMPLVYEGVPLLVTHHPAHLLEHGADKADAWRDLCFAMKLIQRL